jgi:hypothetical protein
MSHDSSIGQLPTLVEGTKKRKRGEEEEEESCTNKSYDQELQNNEDLDFRQNKKRKRYKCHIHDFPAEVLCLIFGFSPEHQFPLLMFTCSRWEQIISETLRLSDAQKVSSYAKIWAKEKQWRLVEWYLKHGGEWSPNLCTFAGESYPKLVYKLHNTHHFKTLIQCNAKRLAIKAGNLTLTKWLYCQDPRLSYLDVRLAARKGHLHILKWLKKYIKIDHGIYSEAGSTNNFKVIKWGLKEKIRKHASVCAEMAKRGNLKMLKWFIQKNFSVNKETICNAAEFGHLHVLYYLLKDPRYSSLFTEYKNEIMDKAAGTGKFHIVQFLHREGVPYSFHVSCMAAFYKKNNIFISTINEGINISIYALEHHAQKGNVEMLEWCYFRTNSKRTSIFSTIPQMAVKFSHKHVLIWTKEKGIPWPKDLLGSLDNFTDLEFIQWLIREGAAWDEDLACRAALRNAWNVVFWALENGKCWKTNDIIYWCAKTGDIQKMKRLLDLNVLWTERTMTQAARFGHFELIKWMREQGAPWDRTFAEQLATTGRLEILKWAYDNSAPWSKVVIANAAKGGFIKILEWCKSKGMDYNIKVLLNLAKTRPRVYQWIQANMKNEKQSEASPQTPKTRKIK